LKYRNIEKYRLWIIEKHAVILETLDNSRNIKLVERSKAWFKSLVKKFVEQVAKEVLGSNPCKSL